MSEVTSPTPNPASTGKKSNSLPTDLTTTQTFQSVPSSISAAKPQSTQLPPADRTKGKRRQQKSFQIPEGKRPQSSPVSLTDQPIRPHSSSTAATQTQSTQLPPADRVDRKPRRRSAAKAHSRQQPHPSLPPSKPHSRAQSAQLPPADRPDRKPRRSSTSSPMQSLSRPKRQPLPTYRKKAPKRWWKLKHILPAIGVLVSLSVAVPTIVLLLQRDPVQANSDTPSIEVESSQKIYPASIPYYTSEAECLEHNKEWDNGKCWDAEHSHLY